MSGNSDARELVTETFSPAQHGHPTLVLVRLLTTACHSWSGPFGHFHQYFSADPATTLSGVRFPFFMGCHPAAIFGKEQASELVTETDFPAQNGQPVGLVLFVRLLGAVCHSW